MKTTDIKVDLIGHFGGDLSVVNAARVSFHKESEVYKEADGKLIQYLAKHKHFSPFNHAFLSFRIKAPIFVARQLVKHKFMPWNEVSRRYVDEEPEFYMPDTWRAKAENIKQGSSDTPVDVYSIPEVSTSEALDHYKTLLSIGVCPEQARMVLPQNTMTEWIWSGTLGAFADMLKLRLDPHTQQETREVAELIAGHVRTLFPVSLGALFD